VTRRDRIVIVVVVALVAIVGSWLLVIQPKRDEAGRLGTQIGTEQSQLATAQSQIAAGQAAKRNYPAYYTSLARLGEAVPSDDNVPSLIYQLQGAAGQTSVDFHDFVLSPSGATNSTPVSSGSAAQGATATLPPGATVGAAGLPIEPFTLTFNGNFFRLASFLGRVQRFVTATDRQISVRGRLMTLNGISLGPGPGGFPQITVTINATAYLSPATPPVGAPGAASSAPSSPSSSGGTTTSSGSFPTATVAPIR
jgi:hypothetical protein